MNIEDIASKLASLSPENLAELDRFIDYLKWKQDPLLSEAAGQPWTFDFVEEFRRAIVTAETDPAGMEVQVRETACGGEWQMALWQHPPVEGTSIVEYQVPVPADVSRLRLRFATGIRDGSELAEGNLVAFRVFVNNWKIWSDTQHVRKWKWHDVAMPAVAGDVARIQFVTDGLGNHQWAWAVWGEPRLMGQIGD
jgi:hypothetical protein